MLNCANTNNVSNKESLSVNISNEPYKSCVYCEWSRWAIRCKLYNIYYELQVKIRIHIWPTQPLISSIGYLKWLTNQYPNNRSSKMSRLEPLRSMNYSGSFFEGLTRLVRYMTTKNLQNLLGKQSEANEHKINLRSSWHCLSSGIAPCIQYAEPLIYYSSVQGILKSSLDSTGPLWQCGVSLLTRKITSFSVTLSQYSLKWNNFSP